MATSRGNRKSGSGTTKTQGARGALKRTTKDYRIRFEVTFIVAFAICVLLFLCNFNLIGSAGNAVSHILFGLFGILQYIFPIYLFLMIFVGMRYASDPRIKLKELAFALLFFQIANIVDLIGGIAVNAVKTESGFALKEFWEYACNKKGGGLIASAVVYLLVKAVSTVGTAIISIIIAIICIIIISENSVVNKLRDSKDRISQHLEENKRLKEDYYIEEAKRREERQAIENKRREEKEAQRLKRDELHKEALEKRALEKQAKQDEKVLRMNKRVSGVTNDTLLVPKTPIEKGENNDIHEITRNDFDPSTGFTDTDLYGDLDEIIIEREEESLPGPEPTKQVKEPPKMVGERDRNTTADKTLSERSFDKTVPDKTLHTPTPEKPAVKTTGKYVFPPINLLTENKQKSKGDSDESVKATARQLLKTLEIFGVKATVDSICQGPTVTRFELIPEMGTKVSRIKSLSDDIKLNLATSDIRIEAPIPGKAAVGIEIPNKENQSVLLRDLIDTEEFKSSNSRLTFAVGKDIAGKVIVYDIDQFPHLLIAGATGSGKSVCINTLIVSLIYKAHPNDVKLIMIDPKVVELSVYNGIPHLLIPVVTDPKKAAAALNWAVTEMMERYKKFADLNVRDLKGYNKAVSEMDTESEIHKKLPQIVVIVDELADLIMVAKNDVEDAICRLAQLARACGIHLIIATQRPSVDVITGLIKANMPSRLAFAVSSGVDSRTILDMTGAEELLGRGDMLFFPKGLKKPVRLQGAFVSDQDVNRIVDFLKKNSPADDAAAIEIQKKIDSGAASSSSGSSQGGSDNGYDELFVEAGKYIISNNKASIGNLQRVYRIGFNRAARIMDQLADAGVVSGEDGTKARQILMSQSDFESFIESNGL